MSCRLIKRRFPLGETQLSGAFVACESSLLPSPRYHKEIVGSLITASGNSLLRPDPQNPRPRPHTDRKLNTLPKCTHTLFIHSERIIIVIVIVIILIQISHPLFFQIYSSRSATPVSSSRHPTEAVVMGVSSRGRICITHPGWDTKRACSTWCM